MVKFSIEGSSAEIADLFQRLTGGNNPVPSSRLIAGVPDRPLLPPSPSSSYSPIRTSALTYVPPTAVVTQPAPQPVSQQLVPEPSPAFTAYEPADYLLDLEESLRDAALSDPLGDGIFDAPVFDERSSPRNNPGILQRLTQIGSIFKAKSPQANQVCTVIGIGLTAVALTIWVGRRVSVPTTNQIEPSPLVQPAEEPDPSAAESAEPADDLLAVPQLPAAPINQPPPPPP